MKYIFYFIFTVIATQNQDIRCGVDHEYENFMQEGRKNRKLSEPLRRESSLSGLE